MLPGSDGLTVLTAPVVIVPRAEAPGQQDGGGRILLVDRQPLFLAAVSRLLSSSQLEAHVDGCADSDEALQIVRRRHYDLVLAEAADGSEKLIRAATERHVPVVLLGESEARPSTAQALRAGAAGLFHKDSSPDEFLTGISAVLAGHRALGASHLDELISGAPSERRSTRPAQLSPTERNVLALLGEGKTVNEIAAHRQVSPKTVRKHLANIYRKLHVRSRGEALLWAARMRLTPN